MTMRPQAKAPMEGPSFGIKMSGGASGGPTCFAPQEAHSGELISRLCPQQGQIIESRRDLLFISGIMKSGATGITKQGRGPDADFLPPFFPEIYFLEPRIGRLRPSTPSRGSHTRCGRAGARRSSKREPP